MMAGMKNIFKNKKKTRAIIGLVTLSFVAIVCYLGLSNRLGAYAATTTTTSVTINGKIYTAAKPYVILEIVPQRGMGELGYFVAGDSMPITSAELDEVAKAGGDVATINAIKANMVEAAKYLTGKTLESDAGIRLANLFANVAGDTFDRNVFAYGIFKDSTMSDKILVKTVAASDVTLTDVNGADFIYVNPKSHLGSKANIEAWNKMVTLVTSLKSKLKTETVAKYKSGTDANASDFNDSNNTYNFSAEIALAIYRHTAVDGAALVFDNSRCDFGSNDSQAETDPYKCLGIMLLAIDQKAFVNQYCDALTAGSAVTNPTYKGLDGTVVVSAAGGTSTKTKLNIYHNGTKLTWAADMFVKPNNDGNYNVGYPYYNAGVRNTYLSGSAFSYIGDNTFDMSFILGSSLRTDYDADKYLGTDFDLAKALYGTDKDGKLLNSNMIAYIMGVDNSTYTTINVLEIQPSGNYEYLGYAGAQRIMKYFGYSTDQAAIKSGKMTADNYKDYVNVKAVAANGFNGMNEDLTEVYDLIIIGEKVLADGVAGHYNNPYTYSKFGTIMSVQNILTPDNKPILTAYSGNDLTGKSMQKLLNYAKNHKPMVIADSIYDGKTTVIDSTSNTYKFSLKNIIKYDSTDTYDVSGVSASNILSEPTSTTTITNYLRRLIKPIIAIDSKYDMQYVGVDGDLAKEGIDADTIDNLAFNGTIGTDSRSYSVVVYMDRDGNGIYANANTDDTNEVYFDSSVAEDGIVTTDTTGKFSIPIELPTSSRGYIAWKIVATDIGTGVSSEDTGGFVIEATDTKTVKVLQIFADSAGIAGGAGDEPDSSINLDLQKNATFMKLFQDAGQATGFALEVNSISATKYENWFTATNEFNKNNYSANNYLSEYSIVVIGFSDSFSMDDISDRYGALSNLYEYIKMGNSVLFTHDTLLYTAYSDGTSDYDSTDGQRIKGGAANLSSYYMSMMFRDITGMDKYGTSVKRTAGAYLQGYGDQFLFKYGYIYDVANKKTTSNRYYPYDGASVQVSDNITTDKVMKLNTGQVTEFPYNIADSLDNQNKLTVAQTHPQWYQLDLEGHTNVADDVVVWYTLAESSAYAISKEYTYSGQDALNSYYIYSKGNITYSGAGHSTMSSTPELKLFVNTIIKAIMSGNSTPSIVVNNAATVSEGVYEQFTRTDTELPEIEFVATDKDLSKKLGTFSTKSFVYWDANSDGLYTAGASGDTILPLVYYTAENPTGESIIHNGRATTVKLEELKVSKPALYASLMSAYTGKNLQIGFYAYDACEAYGKAIVYINHRMLYNLR